MGKKQPKVGIEVKMEEEKNGNQMLDRECGTMRAQKVRR
jgi:hypothetical protein